MARFESTLQHIIDTKDTDEYELAFGTWQNIYSRTSVSDRYVFNDIFIDWMIEVYLERALNKDSSQPTDFDNFNWETLMFSVCGSNYTLDEPRFKKLLSLLIRLSPSNMMIETKISAVVYDIYDMIKSGKAPVYYLNGFIENYNELQLRDSVVPKKKLFSNEVFNMNNLQHLSPVVKASFKMWLRDEMNPKDAYLLDGELIQELFEEEEFITLTQNIDLFRLFSKHVDKEMLIKFFDYGVMGMDIWTWALYNSEENITDEEIHQYSGYIHLGSPEVAALLTKEQFLYWNLKPEDATLNLDFSIEELDDMQDKLTANPEDFIKLGRLLSNKRYITDKEYALSPGLFDPYYVSESYTVITKETFKKLNKQHNKRATFVEKNTETVLTVQMMQMNFDKNALIEFLTTNPMEDRLVYGVLGNQNIVHIYNKEMKKLVAQLNAIYK